MWRTFTVHIEMMCGFLPTSHVSCESEIVLHLTTNERVNHCAVLIAPITSRSSTHDYVSFHTGLSEVIDAFVTLE